MPHQLSEIKKNDFFYVLNDNYDEHIELAIHSYREMHYEIPRFIPAGKKKISVLDLGCGTGKTSAVVLEKFPEAQVYAIDLFVEMLNHARERLKVFADNVELVQGDFRVLPLGKNFDVCISALAIHHHTSNEKKITFRRIFKSLAPNGRFIMIDWTKFESSFIQNISAEAAEENARKSIDSVETVDAWVEHWNYKNQPDTVEDIRTWLEQAGFSSFECVSRYYGLAMIVAVK